MQLKQKIIEEIQIQKEVYKKSPPIMTSAFDREERTEKEYNGRQLLELIQNADDEESTEVKIELHTTAQILSISNRGKSCKPFSFKGIRSLMISNLSSKTTKKYIGNKGLGFRSIINWSNKVTISSNNLDIIFSREVVENAYDELFTKQEHYAIIQDRDLSEDIKPIPFLAIPKVIDNHQNTWTTVIKIDYASDYLDDIKKQLNTLKPEILLFLNAIEKLIVVIDGEVKHEIYKQTLTDIWRIFEKSELLPKNLWNKNQNEEEYYDLKIALQDNLDNDTKELFAFFPTKIQINLPFIVHGTFELNSSRNELVDSKKNRYILKKLVELIVETAKKITKVEVSYKALEMLTYSNPNNILEELGFYESIDSAIEELEVFPCLDGQYRIMSEVIYANELSSFIKTTQYNDVFPNLLIPSTGDVDLDQYSINESVDDELLNKLSAKIDNIDERAELIHLLYNHFKVEDRLVFLIDSTKKLIPLDDDVYTPSKLNFSIPDYVKIKFIHQGLFERLIVKFEIDSNEKARDLQRKLKEITNIQSYEPAQVLQKIVTSTNKELEKNDVDQVEIIKKMIRSLYVNYMQLDKTKIPSDTKIQLLNQDNSLADAKNLFLSKTYPSGKLTDYLFGDIFSSDEFLTDVSIYEFKDDDEIKDIEQFFLWLGVNGTSKIVPATYSDKTTYCRLFFNSIKGKPDYADHMSLSSARKIYNLDEISKQISLEKFIIWCIKDKNVYESFDGRESIDLRGSRGGHINSRYCDISYINYQLLALNKFKDYLIGNEKLSSLINNIFFDFNYKEFEAYKINKADIESMLLKIGAVDKFEKLSIEAVSQVVKELPEKSSNGQYSQAIYKLCIKHFERNKESLKDDAMLLSTKGEIKDYFPLQEVYYNGNIKLPKKITASKAILNYPRRQSTTKVINFFGINNLSTLEIEVTQEDILQNITDEFKTLFDQIKPYILVYRLQDIETDRTARDELLKLQKINIQLCSNVQYKINDNFFDLEDNDYIKDGNKYLIKINSYITIDKLRNDSKFFDFHESFADIIGLAFGIQDTKIFRDMIKEDPIYIEKTIRNDIGSDDLVRARELLGISDEYYSFWKTIYTLLDKNYTFTSDENILDIIKEDLNLKSEVTSLDYSHLNTYESYEYIQQLFAELNLSVENFNKTDSAYYKIDFTTYYKQKLLSKFDKVRKVYKAYVWNQLNGTSSKDQKELKQRWNDYEQIKFTNIVNELNFSVEDYFSECLIQKTNISMNELKSFKMIEFEKYYFEFTEDKDEKLLNILWKNNDIYLSYFKNNHNELNRLYGLLDRSTMDEEDEDEVDEEPESEEHGTTPPPAGSPKPSTGTRNPPIGGGQNPGEKIITGKKGEEIVFKDLKIKFPRVDWVSEYAKKAGVNADGRDGYGYDITYWDKNNQQYFAEVKSTKTKSNGSIISFNMSKNEYEVAIKKGKYYKIFYVSRVGEQKPKIRSFVFNKDHIGKDIENYMITTKLT